MEEENRCGKCTGLAGSSPCLSNSLVKDRKFHNTAKMYAVQMLRQNVCY